MTLLKFFSCGIIHITLTLLLSFWYFRFHIRNDQTKIIQKGIFMSWNLHSFSDEGNLSSASVHRILKKWLEIRGFLFILFFSLFFVFLFASSLTQGRKPNSLLNSLIRQICSMFEGGLLDKDYRELCKHIKVYHARCTWNFTSLSLN